MKREIERCDVLHDGNLLAHLKELHNCSRDDENKEVETVDRRQRY